MTAVLRVVAWPAVSLTIGAVWITACWAAQSRQGRW